MAENLGIGRVAEWFKAAVLKFAASTARKPAEILKTQQIWARSKRVRHPFAQLISAHKSAQAERAHQSSVKGGGLYYD